MFDEGGALDPDDVKFVEYPCQAMMPGNYLSLRIHKFVCIKAFKLFR